MIFRNRFLVLFDIFAILLAVACAFALRFDTLRVWDYLTASWFFAPLLLLIRLPTFYFFGLYRRLWRYASVNELVAILEAVALGFIIVAVAVLILLVPSGLVPFFPRSVILLEGMLTLLLVGGIRFSFRLSQNVQTRQQAVIFGGEHRTSRKRVLIFGAGDAGAMIVREMQANPALGLEPIAFLDDDSAKKGLRIHNVPVLGDRSALVEAKQSHAIDAVIIAMPTAPGRTIREIAGLCHQAELPVKTMPGLYEILGGTVKVSTIREVELEDLLRREPVRIDLEQVGQYLRDARILVTGAGGSIGSELCRQIARFQPSRLILFELSEHNLYQIHRELAARFSSLEVAAVTGDVRDENKVDWVFAEHKPQTIFHAAAYKHVPLMESNVDELVANNVFGTLNTINASLRYEAKRFVLISTDKAVNPRSVMGASKRVAELLVQNAAQQKATVVVAVRFGNVLGSSGSVVPLFKEQIAAGGPVTVTHPEMRRYFMTIPEAASLIIQAAALGQGGETFVLDMGDLVKINDLASDLIRLSGFEPGRDIEIVYTGSRPGEKLREELFTAREQRGATTHQQIFVAQGNGCDGEKLHQALGELEALVKQRDLRGIRAKLIEMIPEYTPEP